MDTLFSLREEVRMCQAECHRAIEGDIKSREENERLKSDLKYFIDRVDAGTIRSKTTYQRFKDTLEAFDNSSSNQIK